MEGLAAFSVGGRFLLPFPSTSTKSRSFSLRRPAPPPVLASRDGPELDKWDQMELKFGRLLGEDPKLTLAKIMARKANPDISYLDVEKSFMKKKGKLDDDVVSVSENVHVERQPFGSPNSTYFSSQKARNLPKDRKLNLSRPVMKKGIQLTRRDERPAVVETKPNQLPGDVDNSGGHTNVTLRKPSFMQGDDIETDDNSKLKIKPNLYLKMRKSSSEDPSDITLLKKPEIKTPLNREERSISSDASDQSSSSEMRTPNVDMKLLNPSEMLHNKLEMTNAEETSDGLQQDKADKPEMNVVDDAIEGSLYSNSDLIAQSSKLDDGLHKGLQPPKQSGVGPHDFEASTTSLDEKSVKHNSDVSRQAALLGKPQRLDSFVKEISHPIGRETISSNDEGHNSAVELGQFVSAGQEEREDGDWKMAEHLLHTGNRAEVELVSCSGRGFVVSFGSLIGFLPYRNLGAKWKFLAFESWLRKKGLDPLLYRQNLSILGNYDLQKKNLVTESTKLEEADQNEVVSPSMKFDDLLEAYEQEKTKFLSSFVGQRIKVSVILADRKSRRVMFSGRPKEKEELVEKKRSLMAKLSIGDVVKCCIKKITYFGIFVEVEGVPALIHQSEVSWDETLDPSSYFKVGQAVDAKVHQLDYSLERITLSLKEMTPDPLMEALESVVGDRTSLGGNLEVAQADIEWADVESLIEELQQIDGVYNVSKGRFFLSPGLAPTFQVYMAPMFANQYKLLARYGNKVQEVLVQSNLDKEQMKAVILSCTNRVK